MKFGAVIFAVISLVLCSGCASQLSAVDPAPRWTVSGLSSGGYMAVALHVAHSSRISGVAALASGPYDCADGKLALALGPCLTGEELDFQKSLALAESRSRSGEIDPLTNLTDDPIWIFHGAADEAVGRPVTQGLVDFYLSVTANDLVKREFAVNAAHGMPTLDQGTPCAQRSPPYINRCNYDAAGDLLRHLHKLPGQRQQASVQQLRTFDQSCCAGPEALMAHQGLWFVPEICQTGGCDMHMVLHGCQQGESFVQKQFVLQAGFLEWAQDNALVVVFPQAAPSAANPLGCWDWWGYTGTDYATKSGAQIEALMAMFAFLSSEQALRP